MGSRSWTEEEDQVILDNWEMTNKEIRELLYHRTKDTIKWRRTVIEDKKYLERDLLPEEIEFLKNNFTSSDKILSRKFQISRKLVLRKRKELGLIKNPVKYYVNVDFFKIWTPEMAYVLGFIYADGYIDFRKGESYGLGITIKDEILLNRINNSMNSSYPVSEIMSKTGPIFQMRIYSKEFVESLLQLGLTPNKSLSLNFPIVPEQYFYHYVRGYFDGDGTVRLIGRHLNLSIACGSKEFAETMTEELMNRGVNCKIYTLTKNRKHPLYNIGFLKGGKDEFCLNLYKGASIYLERKYQIIYKYLNKPPQTDECVDCKGIFTKKHKNHILCQKCAHLRKNYRSKIAKRIKRKEMSKN